MGLLSGATATAGATPAGGRRARATSLVRLLGVVALSLIEARPLVQAIVLLRFGTGVALVVGAGGLADAPVAPVLLTGGAWVLANTAVYLLNGLCDLTADRANGKGRPLARGALDPAAGAKVCVVLAVASLVLALTISPVTLVLVTALLAAGTVYSRPPGRLPVAVTPFAAVAIGGAGTYLAAAVSAGGQDRLALACFGATMTAWMVAVGAVLKDLDDVEGDRRAGRRTPALRYGVARAARFGTSAAALLAVGLGAASLLPHCAVLLVPSLCLGSAALLMRRQLQHLDCGNRASLRAPYRTFMAGQYVAHAALLLTVVVSRLLAAGATA